MFHQIYAEREYQVLDDLKSVQLVIDCGANVGYSSSYFLAMHPDCQVMSVEPDDGNYAMLNKNVSSYGDLAKTFHAGVWSTTAKLAISEAPYRDGRAWSQQVRLCKSGEESSLEGIGIDSLFKASGFPRISMLKWILKEPRRLFFPRTINSG